ncbi:MAG: hypothetical protein JJT85_02600 [Chromatiales bacterium]|nr:hypothetical protein [Chromatiales bacterium]
MKLIGNIVWFILGGWLVFIGYTLAAIVFFPIFIPLFRLARFAAWPFGRQVISRSRLARYREVSRKALPISRAEQAAATLGTGLNILWILTFGWILALIHLLSSIANLMLFWLIVTIPNIVAHWKLMRVAVAPFNLVVIPSEIAEEIELTLEKERLGL